MNRRKFLQWGSLATASLALGCQSPSLPRPSTIPWNDLASGLDGKLVLPGSGGYESSYPTFIKRFDHIRPAGVVIAENEADVVEAVRFAKRYGIHVVARSGGHSFGGYSTTEGMVIDLKRLAAVQVADQHASIGGGALIIDAHAALQEHGLGLPTGSCPTVGLAGLALGGGLGDTGRRYGLTSDRLTGARVVLADGAVMETASQREPELFWALRGGGGGNFGIVTRMDFLAHPVTDVTVFSVQWPWSVAAAVIDAWQRWAPSGSDELTSNLGLSAGDSLDDPPVVQVGGQVLGDRADSERLIGQLEAMVGRQPSDAPDIATMPYHAAVMDGAGCADRTVAACHVPGENPEGTLSRYEYRLTKSQLFNRPLPQAGIDRVIGEVLAERVAGYDRDLEFASLGGAYNRIAPDATAFVHRDCLFNIKYATNIDMSAAESVKESGARWIERIAAAMTTWTSGQAYQNYIDPSLANWQEAYYGPNYRRLRQVKHRYDPDRFFTFAQAIDE
jgi:FAD/FMN-containing dehydrogenase